MDGYIKNNNDIQNDRIIDVLIRVDKARQKGTSTQMMGQIYRSIERKIERQTCTVYTDNTHTLLDGITPYSEQKSKNYF